MYSVYSADDPQFADCVWVPVVPAATQDTELDSYRAKILRIRDAWRDLR